MVIKCSDSVYTLKMWLAEFANELNVGREERGGVEDDAEGLG